MDNIIFGGKRFDYASVYVAKTFYVAEMVIIKWQKSEIFRNPRNSDLYFEIQVLEISQIFIWK